MLVSEIIWSKYFWLPLNLTWDDLQINGKNVMPSCLDLSMSVPVAMSLICCRYFLENFIARPVGRSYNLKEKSSKKFVENEKMEKLLKKFGTLKPKEKYEMCAKESNWSSRQIERYLREFKKSKVPSEMDKFAETSWLVTFHFLIFCFGIYSLWDKKWFSDTSDCWNGWPFEHVITTEIYWYYVIETGFYIAASMSLCIDVKRKDFKEMIIHHISTIGLLLLSYTDNFFKVGSLILVLHDPCDVLLHFAKIAKYVNYQRLTDTLFVVFSISWFVTRLIIFPFKILIPCIFHSPFVSCSTCHIPYLYYIITGMLCSLQILHVIWFGYLVKAIKVVLTEGQIKDARSDTDEDGYLSTEKCSSNDVYTKSSCKG